jgi:hypothetical protein
MVSIFSFREEILSKSMNLIFLGVFLMMVSKVTLPGQKGLRPVFTTGNKKGADFYPRLFM